MDPFGPPDWAYRLSSTLLPKRSVKMGHHRGHDSTPSIGNYPAPTKTVLGSRGTSAHGTLDPDVMKMPHVKQAVRQTSAEQWASVNSAHCQRSEQSHRQALELRTDTRILLQTRQEALKRMQGDTSRLMGQMMGDRKFWSSEINHEAQELMKDTKNLKQVKSRLDKAVSDTEGPLQVAQECLCQRQKRLGTDQVSDSVEKELLQEVAVIQSCQELLERAREAVKKQLELKVCVTKKALLESVPAFIGLKVEKQPGEFTGPALIANRAVQRMLEKNLHSRHTALDTDSKFQTPANCSSSQDGRLYLDKCISALKTWAEFSGVTIAKSQNERTRCRAVRDEAERIMEKTDRDMWVQFDRVNRAFAERISETTKAKKRLQQHLTKTLQEMFETEGTISALEHVINNEKRVFQTPMEERIKLPHTRLLGEVKHVNEAVGPLWQRLSEARQTLRQLADARAALEQELFIKAHSLFIDQERCMSLRKAFPHSKRLLGSGTHIQY